MSHQAMHVSFASSRNEKEKEKDKDKDNSSGSGFFSRKKKNSSGSSEGKTDKDNSPGSGLFSKLKRGKSDRKGYNALQKHVAFFDRNGDGVIYPWETYQGFVAIGAPRLGSAIAAVFINLGLSQKTRPGKGFSPLFPIEVKNSRLCMHGSDTDVYDKHGRFVESKFEEIFKKHARKNKNALTYKEIMKMLKSNRDPKDFAGWMAAFGEWKLLHSMAKDKNGMLTKETVRDIFDDTLFKQLEKNRKEEQRSSSSRDKKDKQR